MANLLVAGAILGAGLRFDWKPGLAVGAAALAVGSVVQVLWLARGCRPLGDAA